jgi:hypothetical protein
MGAAHPAAVGAIRLPGPDTLDENSGLDRFQIRVIGLEPRIQLLMR